MNQKVPFKIEYLDNLGQGISKINGKITIVPKSLPDEEGLAVIDHEKPKIEFTTLNEIHISSDRRVEPECAHYNNCQGCHYLHTDYKHEKELKKKAYARMFKKWVSEEDIKYISADQRLEYRNRVQLHYDLSKNQLGFINKDSITQVPNCLVSKPEIQNELKSLYKDNSWQKMNLNKVTGHIEIYKRDGNVVVSEDLPYAAGGFSQVNESMNSQLINQIHSHKPQNTSYILDLFGGAGNLTSGLTESTLVVDSSPSSPELKSHQEFFNLNIYSKAALKNLKTHIKNKVDWLILDPPRSGLKNLNHFLEELRPDEVTYVSCGPQNQVRDLSNLPKNYIVKEVTFIDLFPSTYHLETVVHIVKVS
jgi:23S rRNA (uracil1939-C5)-methyltransferase